MTDHDDHIKDLAGATKEVAKASGKAIDLAADIGGFLHKVIGEPMEIAAGTYFTDPLRQYRIRRLHRLVRKTNEILDGQDVAETRKVPPKTLVPLIDNASLEDDDLLHDMWAGLLATAMRPKAEQITKRFVEALSNMDAREAHLLIEVNRRGGMRHAFMERRLGSESTEFLIIGFTLPFLHTETGLNSEYIAGALNNLLRLGLLTYGFSIPVAEFTNYVDGAQLRRMDTQETFKTLQFVQRAANLNTDDSSLFCLSTFGGQFCRAIGLSAGPNERD